MRTLVNFALFTFGLLLSVSCMKTERLATIGGPGGPAGGGGGNAFANGTAGVLTGDQRMFKNLSAMGVAINNEIRDQFARSSRNVMPFTGAADNVNPVNTYSGTLDAMRIALLAVNTGIAGNGTVDNREIFAPARAVAATAFSEVEYLRVAENVGMRVLRRPLMESEKEILVTEIYTRIKGTSPMSAALRTATLASMIASIMISMDSISAN